MKNLKKLASLVLALVMVFALATTAFAEGTYTLTLNNAIEGHTYTAYQIFTGDLDNEGVLSNIVWGSGVTDTGKTTLGPAAQKAESLKNTADAEDFAAEVAPYLANAAGSTTITEDSTTGTINGLTAGYYLVQTTDVPTTNDVYTYYILKVVADTEANVKADVPKVKKDVSDADVSIGETVTYTLTATMPSNIQGYRTYKVVFTDTMAQGLTYGAISSVTVAGTTVSSGYDADCDNGVLTVTFDDVLSFGAQEKSEIVVQYTATVNSDAVIGTEGNENTVKLTYSNNPNWDGTGTEPTGDTPVDTEKVYTWEIPVFKYTGANTPLPGAGFILYTDANCTNSVNLVKTNDPTIFKACTAQSCSHTTHEEEIVTGDTGRFQIEGLQKGDYYLKEKTTPPGYNTCDVVHVNIGDNGALTQNGEDTIEVKIENHSGSTLPSTGGIGTTLFYVFGGVLVLAAVVLLVTKKRMNTAK